MTTAFFAFLSSTVFAALMTPVVRLFAVRFDVLDHALTARKIHGRPLPRLGGIAIVSAFYVTVVGLFFWRTDLSAGFYADRAKALGFLTGGLLIGLLGAYDDFRGCKAGQKFLVQFAVAALMYQVGFRIEALSIPFGRSVDLGFLSLPFTLVWIVGVTNAFNLIDGLDGLAGGVALVAVATNFVIALGRGEHVMVLLSAALGGAILGFLFYNFNPASIFMGDTGSMFLGFVLGTIAIQANQKAYAAVAILIPVTALGLPLLDTALAVVRRAAWGRPIFRADREHIHHRLLEIGLTQRQAVLALYVLSVFLGTMAVALTYANSAQSLAIMGGLGGVFYLLLSRLGYVGGTAWETLPGGGGPREVVRSLVAERLRGGGARDIWEAVKGVAELVGADGMSLSVEDRRPNGETVSRSFTTGLEGKAGDAFRARFRIPADGREAAVLEFGWRQPGFRLKGEHQDAIEELCEEIGRALGGHAHSSRAAGGREPAKVLRISR